MIKAYLPEQLSDDVLATMVQDAIAQTGAASVADTGKVIGMVMKQAAGKVSGDRVSALVKEQLQA